NSVQMLIGSAAREDNTASLAFVALVPTPGHVFTTTATSLIMGMFVAECRMNTAGQRLEVQITVDGTVMNPGAAVLTTNTQYETHSHVAFRGQVPAGRHTVTVAWRVSGGRGYVRNRSLTVWEIR
ncbi:MAG TPA: hypothetical protein VGB38_01410, partial [bacterium]